jgi:hypothetical protein
MFMAVKYKLFLLSSQLCQNKVELQSLDRPYKLAEFYSTAKQLILQK